VMREAVSGKTSDRQGLSRSLDPTIMTRYQAANQAIGSKPIVPGAQEEALIVIAEKAIDGIAARADAFFAKQWKDYKALVEATKMNPFKE